MIRTTPPPAEHSSAPPLVILGSASPRRAAILTMLGIEHVVCAGDIDEAVLHNETPAAYVERMALHKLRAARKRSSQELARDVLVRARAILAADTMVLSPAGEVLGKPKDAEDARRMLLTLSDRVHEVWTRMALGAVTDGAPREILAAETVRTRVAFRPLSVREIDAYVATGEGTDKAGGYAVQGRASSFVPRIDGSYTNVVGLPACELVLLLQGLGWT